MAVPGSGAVFEIWGSHVGVDFRNSYIPGAHERLQGLATGVQGYR